MGSDALVATGSSLLGAAHRVALEEREKLADSNLLIWKTRVNSLWHNVLWRENKRSMGKFSLFYRLFCPILAPIERVVGSLAGAARGE